MTFSDAEQSFRVCGIPYKVYEDYFQVYGTYGRVCMFDPKTEAWVQLKPLMADRENRGIASLIEFIKDEPPLSAYER
jgi:hypothetical protein